MLSGIFEHLDVQNLKQSYFLHKYPTVHRKAALPLVQNNKALLAYLNLARFELAIVLVWVECSSFLLMKVMTYWQTYLKTYLFRNVVIQGFIM